jgi:hypothetical protein
MNRALRNYFARIGRRGGKASRRALGPETAREMVRIREARRAYRRFYHQCFWSYAPDLTVRAADVPWVIEQLRKCGGAAAWKVAAKLCL